MASPSKTFGLWSLTSLVVASTIGAGVYTTSGYTLKDLGTREAVMAVWLLAAVVAVCGAVSFGSLAKAMPQSGGEYLFLSRLMHPAAGFIAGWVSLLAGFAGAQAFAAITFTRYLSFDSIPYLETGLAVALLIGLSLIHGGLVKFGNALQNLAVGAKALFLLVFIAVGWQAMPQVEGPPGVLTPGFWVWPNSLLWVSLSFTGYNAAIYVAEECRNPRRDIPKALVFGTVITAVLYLAVNAVFLYSAPISELSGVSDIALVAAQALGGPSLRRAVQGLVLLSLCTLLSGMAVSGPRVVVKMGEDGFLPSFTLGQASIIQCSIAVVMTIFSNLASQLVYLSLTLSATSALTVFTVFRLPKTERPAAIFPLVYLGATCLAAVASLVARPLEGLFAIGTLVSGGILYFILRGRARKVPNPLEVGKLSLGGQE